MKKIHIHSFALALPILLLSSCSLSSPDNFNKNAKPDKGGQATQTSENKPEKQNNENDSQIRTVSFRLSGENFKFYSDGQEAPVLRVKKGDKVKIELTSIGGFHDWVLDEFNAATKKINAGESSSVEFIAGQSGIFEYYCSVGNHRAMGMKGQFIIE